MHPSTRTHAHTTNHHRKGSIKTTSVTKMYDAESQTFDISAQVKVSRLLNSGARVHQAVLPGQQRHTLDLRSSLSVEEMI